MRKRDALIVYQGCEPSNSAMHLDFLLSSSLFVDKIDITEYNNPNTPKL